MGAVNAVRETDSVPNYGVVQSGLPRGCLIWQEPAMLSLKVSVTVVLGKAL